MSYDISIGTFETNYTSNVVQMWDIAMPDLNLRDMHGKTGRECLPHLLAGVTSLNDYPAIYDTMAPENGRGNRIGARITLSNLAVACREFPNHIVEISR